MTPELWRELLLKWCKQVLQLPGPSRLFPPGTLDPLTGWIGYPAASQDAIEKAESRLGLALPGSYKNFLMVTNGWPLAGPYVSALMAVNVVDWFSKKSEEWLSSWRMGVKYGGGLNPVPDEDYFVYGERQNPLLIRDQYLDRALQISDGGIGVYLLNPEIGFPNSEWEAWVFEPETGAQRYRSFWDLMVAEHQSFVQIKDI